MCIGRLSRPRSVRPTRRGGGGMQNPAMDSMREEIAATAARMVVEEGLEYGPAKRRAVKQLGLSGRAANCPTTTWSRRRCATTSRVLRRHAAGRTGRAAPAGADLDGAAGRIPPHLAGAVWHGTATRLSDIYLQLFCDDPKSAEIALIDRGGVRSQRTVPGFHGAPVEALSISSPCPELGEAIGVHLLIHDLDDVRGALKRDTKGRVPRGDAAAVRALVDNAAHAND
jgi:hypothetical protein